MATDAGEKRVSWVGVISALVGSLIGTVGGVWGTYAKFAEDRTTARREARIGAYQELKAQQGRWFIGLQRAADTEDKATLYLVREMQFMTKPPLPPEIVKDKELMRDLRLRYAADAVQQEQNMEHVTDDLSASGEKLLSAIGAIESRFPPDTIDPALIERAQAVVLAPKEFFPIVSSSETARLLVHSADTAQMLNERSKERTRRANEIINPIRELLSQVKLHLADPL